MHFLQVSWLKRQVDDHPHLLTYGLATYSNDARFQIIHEQPNDWKLQIQFPQKSDEGVYECLVSSSPPIRRRIQLRVVGESSTCVRSYVTSNFECKNVLVILQK